MSTSPQRPADASPPPEGTASRGLRTAVVVLLLPAAVLPLCVWLYDRTDPELAGFPFYFWFQFALIPLAAGLTFAAFVLSKRADERDRAARGVRRSSEAGGR